MGLLEIGYGGLLGDEKREWLDAHGREKSRFGFVVLAVFGRDNVHTPPVLGDVSAGGRWVDGEFHGDYGKTVSIFARAEGCPAQM